MFTMLDRYQNRTSASMFFCNFAAYFRIPFPNNSSGGLLLLIKYKECNTSKIQENHNKFFTFCKEVQIRPSSALTIFDWVIPFLILVKHIQHILWDNSSDLWQILVYNFGISRAKVAYAFYQFRVASFRSVAAKSHNQNFGEKKITIFYHNKF